MKNKNLIIIAVSIMLFLFSMFQYNSILEYLTKSEYNLNSLSYQMDSAIGDDNSNDNGISSEMEDNSQEPSNIAQTESTINNLFAISALLMDGENNRVLYEKSGYKEMPMASTTKIMTCITALENGTLDDIVTVSKYASTMPDVQLNIREGEQYTLKDLLYSLMLESHNDTAAAIAEHIGGSVEGFAALMNEKAKALGCNNTNFVTPNGLDADGHQTTARDLAVIASYAIKNEQFIEITNTPAWQFSEVNNKRNFSITNKDRFLYSYNGAIGVKTGYTSKAGYCFVGAAKRENKTFLSVVLASGWPPNKNYKWSDTKQLMDYGFNNYNTRQIVEEGKSFEPILVVDGKNQTVDIMLEGEISLLMRDDEYINIIYDIPKALEAPVQPDQTIGKADYYIDDELYASLPITAVDGVEKIDFKYCLDHLLDLWFFHFQ